VRHAGFVALGIALLVACGDDHQVMRDGGDGGGSSDDADIDADPNVRGTVTVRIVDKNGAVLDGMYVVFVDTDGTITERMTDVAGMAQADVYPNATVTAVRARGMSFALATVQALNPGDVITLVGASPNVSSSEDAFSQRVVPPPSADIAASPAGATKSGSTATFTTLSPHGLVAGDRVIVANVGVAGYNGAWTVASAPSATTFTANLGSGGLAGSGTVAIGATATKALAFSVSYAAYAGVDHYEVHTRCGTTDVGTVTTAPLVLAAHCAASPMDLEVHAKSSAGVTLAWTQQPNVTIAANGSTTITDTWHAPETLTATYTNPTAEVTTIQAARFSPYMRGLPVAETSAAATATTTLMLDVSKPANATIATQLLCPSGSSCLSTGMGSVSQRITVTVDGTQSTYALDVGANLLPWVKAVYVASTTSLDMTVVGSGAIDIFEANLRFTRGQNIYTWRVFGPAAQTVKFPTLPATAPGDPTVRPADIPSSYQAFVGESDAINGYRAAIKNPFEALGTCEASPSATVKLYGGATNRISQWN
jgi:hypothetical protein